MSCKIDPITFFEICGVEVISGPEHRDPWDPPEGVSRMDWRSSDGRVIFREVWQLPEEERNNRERLIYREAVRWQKSGWVSDFREAAKIIKEILRVGYSIKQIRSLLESGLTVEELWTILKEAREQEYDPGLQEIPGSYFENIGFEEGEDFTDLVINVKIPQQEAYEIHEAYVLYNAHRDWGVYPLVPEDPELSEEIRWALVRIANAGQGLPKEARAADAIQAQVEVTEFFKEMGMEDPHEVVNWFRKKVIPRFKALFKLERDCERLSKSKQSRRLASIGVQLYSVTRELKGFLEGVERGARTSTGRRFAAALRRAVKDFVDRAWQEYRQAREQANKD